MNWTKAKDHAVVSYPNESCGLVVNETYIPCDNIDDSPTEGFEIDPKDFQKASSTGLLEYIVHSHPGGPCYPTSDDMESQIETDVPWAIIPIYKINKERWADDPVLFGDQIEPLPLLGRPFRHGITDCFALMRDFYRMELDIVIPEFPRSWCWWEEDGVDLYSSGLKDAGFRDLLPGETPRYGDPFLASIRSDKVNHGGILLRQGKFIHHPITSITIGGYDPSSLSKEDSISRWIDSPMFRKFIRYDNGSS